MIMNKTQVIKKLKDLFILNDQFKNGNIDTENLRSNPLLLERADKILRYFGLTPSSQSRMILDNFLSRADLTPISLEKVIIDLSAMAVECLSRPVVSSSEKQCNHQSSGCFQKKQYKPILINEMLEYVRKNLLLPLSDKEFDNTEIGFRLRWNYSTGQMVGDEDFKRSADQYLTSIDFPMEREKMAKIVDLILEYLQEVGQWGHKDDW
jgi:hypothetical protein